jgi:hypothetical protein
MNATKLPTPLPTQPSEYQVWREKASASPTIEEDDEDAWFELDRLMAEEPKTAWSLLTGLAARCREQQCMQIAAGPLTTFLRLHRDEFSSEIDEELMRNEGFRAAYQWLQ